uniref:Protein SHQ1 homolog n=1 Tax=Graphocephala atropunctata TaxID=36148 RepID=A0A1B6M5G6_9HEMI
MLTPSFQIAQTNEHLIINIQAPYTQLKDVEINALGSEFWFYSSPYFLRLHFPCGVVDDDEPPASFNADKGEFEIRLCKEVAGQHFPDLDLLGTLLAPKKQDKNVKPSIEVVSETVEEEEDEDEDLDEWLIEQELPSTEPETEALFNAPKYGFGNLTQGVFKQLKSEFQEIIDLPEPDLTPAARRVELRMGEEDKRFCCDHYLADYMEPEVVREYLAFSPSWLAETTASGPVKLTETEKSMLKNLGNKEFLLNKEDKVSVWLSLVDIVFAFAYNHRTTLGENTVESAWTINKLSATLSWFANHSSVRGVVVSCFRRLLTYSLYRHWDLAQLVLKDTIAILKLGRRQVLKCLLEVHSLFAHSEPRYLLNQLYISDYCIWLQRASERKLARFAEALEQVNICKGDVGFDLEELEHAALLVQEEEESLTDRIENLHLDSSRSSSSSETESSSSEDSSSLDSDDDSSEDSCQRSSQQTTFSNPTMTS